MKGEASCRTKFTQRPGSKPLFMVHLKLCSPGPTFSLQQKLGSSYLDLIQFLLSGGGPSEGKADRPLEDFHGGGSTPRVVSKGLRLHSEERHGDQVLRPPRSPAEHCPANVLASLGTPPPELWL